MVLTKFVRFLLFKEAASSSYLIQLRSININQTGTPGRFIVLSCLLVLFLKM